MSLDWKSIMENTRLCNNSTAKTSFFLFISFNILHKKDCKQVFDTCLFFQKLQMVPPFEVFEQDYGFNCFNETVFFIYSLISSLIHQPHLLKFWWNLGIIFDEGWQQFPIKYWKKRLKNMKLSESYFVSFEQTGK